MPRAKRKTQAPNRGPAKSLALQPKEPVKPPSRKLRPIDPDLSAVNEAIRTEASKVLGAFNQVFEHPDPDNPNE